MMFSGVIEKNQNILDGDSNLIGRLGSIVVQFIAIIFVWLAFTTVGRVTRWTGKIVEPIASLSKQIGMSGVKSIKLPGVGSVGGAMKMPEIIQNKVREKNIDYHNDLAHSSIGRMLGVAEQQRPSSPRISAQINTGTTISSITVNSTGQATVS